jgi:hypothetical protein
LITAGANMKQQKIFLLLQNALLQLQHQILQPARNASLRDSGFSLFRSAVELDKSKAMMEIGDSTVFKDRVGNEYVVL